MARVAWAKDYGQYKKGEEFDVEGDTLQQYLDSGIVRLVKGKSETATTSKAETADASPAASEVKSSEHATTRPISPPKK